MNNTIKLINGDAFTIENLPEQVDAIITDPPYNIARDNNFTTMGRSGIDFGEWDKNFDDIGGIPKYAKMLRGGGDYVNFL